MPHEPLKVTFHLDGTGSVWYPSEPLHLDGVLAYAALARSGQLTDLAAEDKPIDADIPLAHCGIGDSWFWSASVLLPVGSVAESMQMARRRVNIERAELVADKTINMEINATKSQNRPWLLQLSAELVGYCVGDIEAVRTLCKDIHWRGAGQGKRPRDGRHGRTFPARQKRDMGRDGDAVYSAPARRAPGQAPTPILASLWRGAMPVARRNNRMKAVLTLPDKNSAMRMWLKQAKVDETLKNVLKKSVKAPWVAKVEEGGRLSFLRGKIDYASARDVGSQGVVYRFILESGSTYRACFYERDKAIVSDYRVADDGELIKL